MATIEDLITPSTYCIRFLGHTEVEALVSSIQSLGVRVFHIAGETIYNDSDLFKVMSEEIGFPSYFGHNWNAFDDCLVDMDGKHFNHYLTIVHHGEKLWQTTAPSAGGLVESWQFISNRWIMLGVSSHLVFEWSST